MDKQSLLRDIERFGSIKIGDYILWYERGSVKLDYGYGKQITNFDSLEDAYENGMVGGYQH